MGMQHSFDIDIAKKYGVNCAVLLNNIYFWTEKNRANEKNYHDGRYWTYNTKKAFSVLLPYLTERQIDYAIKKLIDDGLLITGNYNAAAYDRTLWYAITDFGYSILQNCEMETTKLSNGFHSSVEPIPYINTDINPDYKPNKNIYDAPDGAMHPPVYPVSESEKSQKEKPVKHKYGEYNNVLLTDEELDKIKTKFPDWQDRIERLSGYIASKGTKYKSHYATILNWARRDKEQKPVYRQTANTPAMNGYGESADLTDLDDLF